MSEVYLVGYDGSEAADAALRFTHALATQTGAEVMAVNVYERVPYVFARGAAPAADLALEQAAHDDAERLLAAIAIPDVRTTAVAADSVTEGLHHQAEQGGAALLAVGATHRRGPGRVLPGGVADRLIHGAPCPVLVVPPSPPATVKTIGIAYDRREQSEVALRAACDLARQLNARIVMLSVYNPMPVIAPEVGVVDWSEDLRASLEERVGEVARALGAEVRFLTGNPGPALEQSSRTGIDLLVCGSRGYGPLRAVLAGSVSRYLADHAPRPVLVVPRGSAPEEGDGGVPRP